MKSNIGKINAIVVCLFAFSQIVPAGMAFAENDHVNKSLDTLNRDQLGKFGAGWVIKSEANDTFRKGVMEDAKLKDDIENDMKNQTVSEQEKPEDE